MKHLFLFLIAFSVTLSLSAQTKQKQDSTLKLPVGLYILYLDVDEAKTTIKAFQSFMDSEEANKKTQKVFYKIIQQMKTQEENWNAQGKAIADSTNKKNKQ